MGSLGKRAIYEQQRLLGAFYRLVDALCILLALHIAAHLGAWSQQLLLAGAGAVALWFFVAELTGMYRSWRGVDAEREILCAVITWGFALLVLLAAGFLLKYDVMLRRLALVVWFLVTPALIAASRVIVRAVQRYLRSRGLNTRGYAIVGVTELGFQLARNIEASPELGLNLLGFYDDRPADRVGRVPPDIGHRIGNLDELVQAAREGRVHMIYITFPMRAEDRIRDVLARLGDTTASVYVVPDFFVFELLHSRWSNINGLPVVSVFENPLYGVDGIVKRMLDVVLAGLGVAVLALPLAVIALLVKLSSPGPVFFRQKRYGLDGREILVWKFRTMRVCEPGDSFVQATRNDPRVTKVGAVLRRTSLDELPQLFNVLRGEMSLVGPRPHASGQNEEYRRLIQGYMLRHKVKPGITGLAQVSGWRGETDTLEKMEKRIQCDHQYIREWSLWMDLKILFKTIFVVLSRENAY